MGDTLTKDTDSGAHQRRLGSYALFEKLPAYGMIQPYIGRADGQVELVVIKRLLMELAGDVTAQSRFRREARIASNLRHPNLVPAVDVGNDQGAFFLVTEWVRGVSLHAVLERLRALRKRLPLEIFSIIALQVLDGIAYAHAATDQQGLPLGIVHRDLAPHSVLLSFAGEVKVADFGMARVSVDDFKTLPGMTVGSIAYMSPEQAQGRQVDARSDQYSLAVLFYEMLSRQPVVPQGRMLTMLRAVVGEEPAPLASLRPDLPPFLVQAIQRALSKERDERWPDVASFAAAMKAHLPLAAQPSDALSRFARRLLPEREAKMVALLEQIREHAGVIEARQTSGISPQGQVVPVPLDERPEREKATQVVRARLNLDEEPPEPSVMTMPGAPLPAERARVAAPAVSSPPVKADATGRRGTLIFSVGAGLLALGLGVAAWWVSSSASSPAPPEPPSSAGPTVAAQAPAPVEAPVTVAPAAQVVRPAPAVAARAPAPPTAKKPTSSKKRRPSKRPPPSSARLTPEPPEPLAAPAPPPTTVDPMAGQLAQLQRRLKALQSSPPNPLAFEALHRDLVKLARALPKAQGTQVRATLAAAERTFDVDQLAKALKKIVRARRPQR